MTTPPTPDCHGREWGTRSTPECARCIHEPTCGPKFATTRLLEAAQKLGLPKPMVSRAADLAAAMNGEVPIEAIKQGIAIAYPDLGSKPATRIPEDFPQPPKKGPGRPKGSKNKPRPPAPTSVEDIARVTSIPHVGARPPEDDGEHPLVSTEVVDAEQLEALAASLTPEEAAELPSATEAAPSAPEAPTGDRGERPGMGAPPGSSDERRAQDRGWCPGRGYSLNLTTGAMELVDWPGFPAVLRRPDSLAPVLQITFWSVPLNAWVWLVDSPSGREIPPGVVEMTWAQLGEAGIAQNIRRESPEASIRAVVGRG